MGSDPQVNKATIPEGFEVESIPTILATQEPLPEGFEVESAPTIQAAPRLPLGTTPAAEAYFKRVGLAPQLPTELRGEASASVAPTREPLGYVPAGYIPTGTVAPTSPKAEAVGKVSRKPALQRTSEFVGEQVLPRAFSLLKPGETERIPGLRPAEMELPSPTGKGTVGEEPVAFAGPLSAVTRREAQIASRAALDTLGVWYSPAVTLLRLSGGGGKEVYEKFGQQVGEATGKLRQGINAATEARTLANAGKLEAAREAAARANAHFAEAYRLGGEGLRDVASFTGAVTAANAAVGTAFTVDMAATALKDIREGKTIQGVAEGLGAGGMAFLSALSAAGAVRATQARLRPIPKPPEVSISAPELPAREAVTGVEPTRPGAAGPRPVKGKIVAIDAETGLPIVRRAPVSHPAAEPYGKTPTIPPQVREAAPVAETGERAPIGKVETPSQTFARMDTENRDFAKRINALPVGTKVEVAPISGAKELQGTWERTDLAGDPFLRNVATNTYKAASEFGPFKSYVAIPEEAPPNVPSLKPPPAEVPTVAEGAPLVQGRGIRQIVEKAGGEYKEIQEAAGDAPALVLFNEPTTKSRLAIPLEGITEAKVRQRLAEFKTKAAAAEKAASSPKRPVAEAPQPPERIETAGVPVRTIGAKGMLETPPVAAVSNKPTAPVAPKRLATHPAAGFARPAEAKPEVKAAPPPIEPKRLEDLTDKERVSRIAELQGNRGKVGTGRGPVMPAETLAKIRAINQEIEDLEHPRARAHQERYNERLREREATAKPLTTEETGVTIKSAGEAGYEPSSRTEKPAGVLPAEQPWPSEARQGALAGAPPENVPGVGEERPPRPSRERGGEAHPGRPGRLRPEEHELPGGVGGGEGAVAPAAERGRPAETRREQSAKQFSSPAKAGNDYRITPDDQIGEGGAVAKYKANVDAIKLLNKLQEEKRLATPEEQAVLVKYVGWGGIPQVFNPWQETGRGADAWYDRQKELQELLGTDEFEAARKSVLNAHYTSEEVIRSIWSGLQALGFEGGRILEPGMGVGHFFGMMPAELWARTAKTGVELDPTTGNIAKQLYQSANIYVEGYEKTRLPNNFYDLAVGNVPFGDYHVHDRLYDKFALPIHNYFIVKTLDKVRPGGSVALITTHFTMDAKSSAARKLIAERADLVAAIRLPNTAFKGNASTEVTTDLLILRKRVLGEPPSGETFQSVGSVPDPKTGDQIPLNEYFVRRPEMMLGTMELSKKMYGSPSATLSPKPGEIGELLSETLGRIPKEAMASVLRAQEITPTGEEVSEETIKAVSGIKRFGYVVKGSSAYQRVGDTLSPVVRSPEEVHRLGQLLGVRDELARLIDAESQGMADAEVDAARAALGRKYDAFVKKWGPIRSPANVKAMADDPDAPRLWALEDYDPQAKTATKTEIFTKRTIAPRKPPEQAESGKAALLVSLNEKGRLDWDYMARLTGETSDQLQTDLLSEGLAFENPEGGWETSDAYLSGNVRRKLAAARTATQADPKFKVNVEALEKVQPTDLKPSEISMPLGAPWIPTDVVRTFAEHLISPQYGGGLKVEFAEGIGVWKVSIARSWVKDSAENASVWGTDYFYGHELLEHALNHKAPVAYDTTVTEGGERVRVINPQQTALARERVELMQKEFKEWIFSSPEQADSLAEIYNERFNSDRLREFDGSHLTLPGSTLAITLRKRQKDAIWRGLQGGNLLLAHEVGAGKTYVATAIALEARRIGIAKKPVIVVPNHLVEQWASEIQRLYPAAKVLVAHKEDFAKERRRFLMSRIATGDWDAVVVSHRSFERLPVSDETFEEFTRAEIDELESAIKLAKGQEEGRRGSKIVKQLEKAKARLLAKLEQRANREDKDETIRFEELGVDMLVVDESQAFKNLIFQTQMRNVAGVQSQDSNRAFDMFMKSQWITRRNNGRGVIFATGTPVSNTMVEMYSLQRYLAYDKLKELGISSFDAWAGTFAQAVHSLELSPEDPSRFRQKDRLAKFVNLPELMTIYRTFADLVTIADIPEIILPKLQTGKAIVIATPPSEELKAYVAELGDRADAIRQGRVDPTEDNMLKVTGDGKKAALDMRIVHPGTPDYPRSKVNVGIGKMFEIWQENAKEKSTQLVFLDISTPSAPGTKRHFSVYNDVKDKLLKRGVPASQIAFIHDFNSDEGKLRLFKEMNAGRIRILLGSTEKMGSGMNVQRKLIAEHHLDVPWRPADIDQRDGRMVRQGNENPEVRNFRYVTEGSFDAYNWQLLESKQRFITQISKGNLSTREAEDVDGRALTAAEVKAIATGDQRVVRKIKMDMDLQRLHLLAGAYETEVLSTKLSLARAVERIKGTENRIKGYEGDAETAKTAPTGEDFSIEISGRQFTTRKEAGAEINKLAVSRRGKDDKSPVRVGRYGAFEIAVKGYGPDVPSAVLLQGKAQPYEVSVNPENPLGTIQSLEGIPAHIPGYLTVARKDLEHAEHDRAELQEKARKPFAHADELKRLETEAATLAHELEIDADDHQADAGAGIEAKAEPEVGEGERHTETRQAGEPIRPGPGARTAGVTGEEYQGTPLSQLTERVRAMQAEPPMSHPAAAMARPTTAAAVSRAAATALEASRKAWNWYKSPIEVTEFKRSIRKFSGAVQKSHLALQKFVEEARKAVPDPLRQEAIENWIRAGGDEAILRDWEAESEADVRPGYEAALTLTPAEKALARNVEEYYDAKLKQGIEAGILEEGVEHYVNQIWSRPNPVGERLVSDFASPKLQPSFKFARKRLFQSDFEGEQAGFRSPSKSILYRLVVYERSFDKTLYSRKLIKDMLTGKAKDGRPLAAVSGKGIPVPESEAPEAQLVKPRAKPEEIRDYKEIPHPALRKWKWAGKDSNGNPIFMQGDIIVHPDVYQHLKNILGKSAIREWTVAGLHPGRGVLGFGREMKQILLSFATFHQQTVTLHGLEHRINPFRLVEIDPTDHDQGLLIDGGIMVAGDERWEQEMAEGVASTGLVTKIPVIGPPLARYSHWLFHVLIPRLKMTMALHALKRNRQRYGDELTDEQLVWMTADQANAAFGGANYDVLGRNKTLQDLFRLFCLAPDFTEERGRFVGQALRPYGQEQLVALLGGAIVIYTIGRILNKLIDNDGHWDRPFSLVVAEHEYSLRTIQGDVLHLFNDPKGFVYNRLNPTYMRPVAEALTGRDRWGRKRGFMAELRDWLVGQSPIPIQGFLNPSRDYDILESALQSVGIYERKFRTRAEKLAREGAQEAIPLSEQTAEQRAKGRRMAEYTEKVRSAEANRKDVDAAVEAGQLTTAEAETVWRRGQATQLQEDFKRLPLAKAIEVWEAANAEERKGLRALLQAKAQNAWQKAIPSERPKIEAEVRKALGQPVLPAIPFAGAYGRIRGLWHPAMGGKPRPAQEARH